MLQYILGNPYLEILTKAHLLHEEAFSKQLNLNGLRLLTAVSIFVTIQSEVMIALLNDTQRTCLGFVGTKLLNFSA